MIWRYKLVSAFFFFLFFCVSARLFYWQVVRAEELSALGQAQYGRQVSHKAIRGEIKTSDKFPIATNRLSYLVYVNPKEVKDKEEYADRLSSAMDIDVATISALLSIDKFWVSLKSGVNEKEKNKIAKMDLPGVGFEDHMVRYYPEASMGAKLLGFVGKNDKGEDKGYFGLEGYYDRQLKGKSGTQLVIHDASGRPILAEMNNSIRKTDGRDLVLNIDRTIQFLLDKELKDGIERYEAAGGMAAVINPKTGGVLAMSSFPSFDPRSYQEYESYLYKNPFISDTYEPGSTFKPLVMSAALDAGLVGPDTKCTECAGSVEIGGYRIKTWNDKYYPNLTMTEVIQHSDNTGMVFIGKKLGLKRMLSYFNKFRIGDTTGIDLQGEVAPEIRLENEWYPIDLATATFGQGITVTPIELLTAFSSIANEGKIMEPHIVASIESDDNKINILPKQLGQPISAKTAKIMTEMLVNAVDKGEAKWAKPKGYRIAGKTGTAQIPVEGHYDANETIASFIGFAPADDPKFAMLVIVDRPTTSIYGAETAAPIFFRVAKNILTYYGIMPTE